MTVEMKIERIGPKTAKKYLERNVNNFRSNSPGRVEKYAEEMRHGRWEMNGEAIKFATDGSLLDGQHRLAAIVKANVEVEMLVIRGLDIDESTLDKGQPRSVQQWLAHCGFRNCTALASVAKLLVAYECDKWDVIWPGRRVADADAIAMAKRHNDALQVLIRRYKSGCVGLVSCSHLCTVLFVGGSGDPENEAARWFGDKLIFGEDMKSTDPVYHMRKRLIEQTQSRKLDQYMQRALLTLAWNKTVQGDTVGNLKIKLSGPRAAAFPKEILVDQGE